MKGWFYAVFQPVKCFKLLKQKFTKVYTDEGCNAPKQSLWGNKSIENAVKPG